MKTEVKPALVLNNRLAITVGTHNGVAYSEPELRKLHAIYLAIEAKPYDSRSVEEKHAFDIFKGDSKDHEDSSGTWIGDVDGVYWDDVAKGIGFKNWNIVDEDFAKKVEYQLARKGTSFGVSPRLNIIKVNNAAHDIIPKNLAIVLDPAGGVPVMLSKDKNPNTKPGEREEASLVITLNSQTSEPLKKESQEMEKELEKIQAELKAKQEELAKKEEALKAKETELQALTTKSAEEIAALKKEAEAQKTLAANSAKESETLKAEMKGLGEKVETLSKSVEKLSVPPAPPVIPPTPPPAAAPTPEELKCAEDKKKKDEEMAKTLAAPAKESAVVLGSVKPNLSLLNKEGIDKATEQILLAVKPLEISYSLEQAQKAIETLKTIILSLPRDEKEEVAALKRVEATLAKINPPAPPAPQRKGLIIPGAAAVQNAPPVSPDGREDATLASKKTKSIDKMTPADIKGTIENGLALALGLK